MPANVLVDSNIWIYAFVDNPLDDRHQRAREFVFGFDRPKINSQIIRETCHNLIKKAKRSEVDLRAFVLDWCNSCEIIHTPVSQYVLASELRESHAFSYWDSLIVAAALDAGCTSLYSEDMQHGQTIQERLTIINPFADSAP
jgi:predicted nucleic acid-binding protein